MVGLEGPRQVFSSEPFNCIHHRVLAGLFHLGKQCGYYKVPVEEASSIVAEVVCWVSHSVG